MTTSNFNPRSSCEERPPLHDKRQDDSISFQSTLLMRGATPASAEWPLARLPISIHAPHARSDLRVVEVVRVLRKISIHAPHARSDRRLDFVPEPGDDFNPRSSCEERPSVRPLERTARAYFNPRSSCEERHNYKRGIKVFLISIHAPHARSDRHDLRRTAFPTHISIHAPHARSDGTRA